MKTVEIGYISSTDRDYAQALRKITTLKELRNLIDFYQPLTEDARQKAKTMTEADFERFLVDLKKASRARGKTAERITDEWGDIILPRLMLKVGLTAVHFHAPFGTAFIRMQEMGELK